MSAISITPEDLSAVGVTASDATLKIASTFLRAFTGATLDDLPEWLTASDVETLKQMLIFQTAYLSHNKDLLFRAPVSAASQDGQSATYSKDPSYAPVLYSLREQLSFWGTRTVLPQTDDQDALMFGTGRMPTDVNGRRQQWVKM